MSVSMKSRGGVDEVPCGRTEGEAVLNSGRLMEMDAGTSLPTSLLQIPISVGKDLL